MAGLDALLLGVIGAVLSALNGLVLYVLTGLNRKVSDICQKNARDHKELFDSRGVHSDRLRAIETTHHLKGCDAPIKGQS
ncbi:hypothetical protein M0R72_14090 [Candidatus Pacearchaeota archaeon]|jgi:hypothetical protein|nr:hypothetical protein [Candidatus Pacearchaeota archaeon]